MNEQELEQALRRTLQPVDPGEDFPDRVLGRLQQAACTATAAATTDGVADPPIRSARHRRRNPAGRWGLGALLAACVLAGIGLVYLRQQGLERQRGLQVRSQLLEALNIASADVNEVRAVVLGAQQPVP